MQELTMSGDWHISTEPNSDHVAWAEAGGLLFATPAWAQAISAIGARPLFAWNAARGIGVHLPVFQRMGVRVAFLGFPVAGTPWDEMESTDFVRSARQLVHCARVDLLRANRSRMREVDVEAVSARSEVWRSDLSFQAVVGSKRLRKDLAFAQRACAEIDVVEGVLDAAACFNLYAATVRAHGGSVKYTEAYFDKIVHIASSSHRLQVLAAIDRSGRTRGFGVLALHGNVGYYLHGATDIEGKRQGISDLLIERLMSRARDAGCAQFTLMASPWDQIGLIKFKEKWGGERGLVNTYDIANGVLGRGVLCLSRWLSRHDRQAARGFVKRDPPSPS